MPEKITSARAITIIVILGIVVFFNALFNGFVGDDETQVLKNPLIQSVFNIPRIFSGSTFYNGDLNQLSGIYYRPLMTSFFALIYTAFGPQAFYFHLFQTLVHIANSILIFLIIRHFFNSHISAIAATIFLVHPINVEAVAYISDLQDVLFFFFGALALFVEFYKRKTHRNAVLAFLLLSASLLSKETGILFIFIFLLNSFIFHKEQLKRSLFVGLLPIVMYGVFRFVIAQVFFGASPNVPIMQASLMTRLITVPAIIVYYFENVFFPYHLAISQDWVITSKNIGVFSLAIVSNVLIISLLFFLGRYFFNKNKEKFYIYLFFLLWLCLGILFHLQLLFTLDNTVSDRWFYFPFVGLLGIIALVLQFVTISKKYTILVISIVLLLSIRTIVRNSNYYNNFTLYSHDVKYSKDSSWIENGLGFELLKQKRYGEAEKHVLKSVELAPNGSVNWNTYGLFYERTGDIDKARTGYTTAVKNSDYYLAYQNLALFLLLYDKPEIAERFTKNALEKFPSNGYLWLIHALVENKLDNTSLAVEAAQKAFDLSPNQISYNVFNRLSQNLSIEVKALKTDNGMGLGICPPTCN